MVDANFIGDLGWKDAHAALERLALQRAGLELEEGRWLRAAKLRAVHERLGYGSFVEYIERLFGYSPRLTHDKLRVADALEHLPAMAQALGSGAASWSSLRELTRVATPETEQDWLRAASGKTVREVEQMVSGHRVGDPPQAPKTADAERHVLRFEVSGEVLASFREALAKVRRDAGGPLDDDAALLLMARHVLAGASDEGRASYQVAVTLCERCAEGMQSGRGEPIAVAPDVVEMAQCDALTLPRAHVGTRSRQRATQTIPPSTRRAVLQRDQHRCQVPGCRHATFVDVHHIHARADGGAHDEENLLTLCGAHHRACHRGELVVVGGAAGRLQFSHADGTAYGGKVIAQSVNVQTRAFRALRSLGFGEREARRALADSTTRVGTDTELEPLLRHALGLLAA